MHIASSFRNALQCLQARARRVGLFRTGLRGSVRTLLRATGTVTIACAVGGAGHALDQRNRPPPQLIASRSADAGSATADGGAVAEWREDGHSPAAAEPASGMPCGKEVPATKAATTGTEVSPIDLNTATAAELTTLPGIGQKRAERILALRERLGRFRSVDDLLRARGLGRSLVKRLRPLVRVGPAGPG